MPFGTVRTRRGRRPPRADDRFLLASITKGLTALQVVDLLDAAGIPLSTPLASLVPAFGTHGKQAITVAHVLTHTAGISETANSAEDARAGEPAAVHRRIALDATLAFAPGSAFAYSSPGFWVLAELIERLAGMSHVAHFERSIAAPLRLADTRYEPGDAIPRRYVLPQAGRGDHHEAVRACAYPAGGVVGSARDLVALGRALIRAARGATLGALRPATVSTLRRPGARGRWQGTPVRWGHGWELGGPGTFASEDALFCSGGAGTALWIDPHDEIVVALLTSNWSIDRELLARVGDRAWKEIRR